MHQSESIAGGDAARWMKRGLVFMGLSIITAVTYTFVAPIFIEPGCGIDVTRTAVGPTAPFAKALKLYRAHMGDYPSSEVGLRALVLPPSDPELAAKWKGPYLETEEMLRDPWGHSYRYRYPGELNESQFEMWSVGPDGQDGTEDDITSWYVPTDEGLL